MAEIKKYWIGEIADCPVDLPPEIKSRPGVCLLTNCRTDDALYELMEYCEPLEEYGREFNDFDVVQGLRLPPRTRCLAWILFEKKPPELDPKVIELLTSLIIDETSREPIYNLMTLMPWTIRALSDSFKNSETVDQSTEE
jgi:hypothetical protein